MKDWEHGCSELEKDHVGKIKAGEFHLLYDHYLLLIPTWLKDTVSPFLLWVLLCQWHRIHRKGQLVHDHVSSPTHREASSPALSIRGSNTSKGTERAWSKVQTTSIQGWISVKCVLRSGRPGERRGTQVGRKASQGGLWLRKSQWRGLDMGRCHHMGRFVLQAEAQKQDNHPGSMCKDKGFTSAVFRGDCFLFLTVYLLEVFKGHSLIHRVKNYMAQGEACVLKHSC